jgi:molybdenum cofactor cytidylyltransferase
MNLSDALRIEQPQSIAFVGAGGKTTALFNLARQLPAPVIVTTTTHLAKWQIVLADKHLPISPDDDIMNHLNVNLGGVLLITGPELRDKRLSGLDLNTLEHLYTFTCKSNISLLIEADGSMLRPLKAPAEHEPAIPGFVDKVVVVAGLSALDQPLSEAWVHRPERFAGLSGLAINESISLDALASVLTNQEGGLKGVPNDADVTTLLNQADTPELLSKAKYLSSLLLPYYQSVIIASLKNPNQSINRQAQDDEHQMDNGYFGKEGVISVIEQVAGIILAAGSSSRLGTPKQLLYWQGRTFIEQAILNAQESRLSPIVVVIGAFSEKIEKFITNKAVNIVINEEWSLGQSASIRAGVNELPQGIGAVVFLLVDQPHISPLLINKLIDTHANSLSSIVVPIIDGKRGNPVLFDQRTFPDLRMLEGDIGGRKLFSKYHPEWVEWFDT